MNVPLAELTNTVALGTTADLDGTEIVAMDASKVTSKCKICAFRDRPCQHIPCFNILWLTPLAAVTHKLTT